MSRTSSTFVLAFGALVVVAIPAFAQAPTQAQQQQIRSSCSGDYRKNCSDVPTGGMDALVCLEKHVDSLSAACKAAVEAVEPPTPAASSASTSAPAESSPPADSPPPATSTTPPTPPASIPPAASAPPAAAAPMPPLTLRQEMRIAGGACAVDFRLFCPNLPVGHGNVIFCLRVHGPRLAPACHEALVRAGVSVE